MVTRSYELTPTTQGPLYPPSEVLDADGNFIVVGFLTEPDADGGITRRWGRAIVAADTPVPKFGELAAYTIVRELGEDLSEEDAASVLHTLPLPLPANNYPMVFAPDQRPDADTVTRPSYPFHETPIPDFRPQDGRKLTEPVILGAWLEARGTLEVTVDDEARSGEFRFEFTGLIPDSLYTVMSLRAKDLDPDAPTRPGPLGVPNVFTTDENGTATYRAVLPNPFPDPALPGANRIISVVVLWQSYQQNYGGAIGHFGLGGDIHAQLKLPTPVFDEFVTRD
ncbi:hypothetical protein VMT65_13630 [Nocardia sp. CDC153]|uniref:hypothetical protein n=1 Tax=Nocardia sp. CDC153 TaxID=3112167 RepID=UPI002DC050DF|nr:hypothetical protein [Nocardia sp. CDC153]MEC3954073.1 hypothetical protein [Nocardia sp. CDC153]